jgi:hypothetical protein
MAAPDGDPGWGGFWSNLGALLSVGFSHGQPAGTNLLIWIRGVYVAQVVIVAGVGVVVAIFAFTGALGGAGVSAGAVAPLVAGFGILSLVVAQVTARPLDCTDDAKLAGSYRVRFFLRVGFADLPSLIGFVGLVLTGETWIYLMGLPFSVVGLVWVAPTAGRIEQEQEQLGLAGCPRSLLAALQLPAPPSSR